MKKIKSQSTLMWRNIDRLKSIELRKDVLEDILVENHQKIPVGHDALYLAIGDGMTFGALPWCPECKAGPLVVCSDGYKCTGQISEWTRCTYRTCVVERQPWSFPKSVRESDPFLGKYKYKKLERVFPPKAPFKPLKNKKVKVLTKTPSSKAEIKALVEKLGGAITTSVHLAYFCLSTKEGVAKMSKNMHSAQLQDVFVVSEDILKGLEAVTEPQPLLPLLVKHSVCDWGSEQQGRGSGHKRALEEVVGNVPEKKMKMVVKAGAAVDQQSGLEHKAHVLVSVNFGISGESEIANGRVDDARYNIISQCLYYSLM